MYVHPNRAVDAAFNASSTARKFAMGPGENLINQSSSDVGPCLCAPMRRMGRSQNSITQSNVHAASMAVKWQGVLNTQSGDNPLCIGDLHRSMSEPDIMITE